MNAEVIVCCGVGGAGKTTTSAALGVGHALAGRKVVVLTIDPARRLADALGIEQLGNTPSPIPLPADATGRLDALMLDRKATWDEVIRGHASDAATADRLLANPYYRALSTRLTGGHEYMATEKLYALATDGTWDLVIVDTPPSQHAIDFFRAPDRIRRILDQKLLGALLRPAEGFFGVATRRVVDVIRKLAGEQVMDDLTDFFQLIGDLSEGFRERGAAVHDLLRDERTRFLLVANALAPREHDLLEFLAELETHGQHFGGFLLNRVAERLPASVDAVVAAIPDAPKGIAPDDWEAVRAALTDVTRSRAAAASQHTALAARLATASRSPVWPVPNQEGGVADLEGLLELASHLPPEAKA